MSRFRRVKGPAARWLAALLLLLFFARLAHTAGVKSVTYDEVIHLFGGALFWERRPLFGVTQNPPLVNALIGLPLTLSFEPALPGPIQPVGDWLKLSKAFMWEVNSNGLQMIWVGRVVIMCLAVLLGALVYRWSRQLFSSRGAGLLALLLFTNDPNILAHSFLATTDLGFAFFLFLAGYLVWRYWRRSTAGSEARARGLYLAAGVAVGAALAAKFSGLILVPALLLMAGYRRLRARFAPAGEARAGFRPFLEVAGWLLLGGLVFLLVYRFSWETIWLDFSWQQAHQLEGQRSFLVGEFTRGTWRYFPIVFALKTPLPVLALLALGGALLLRRRRWEWQWLWPALLAAGIGGAALTSKTNIGYRYLLSALPFGYLLLGQLAQPGALRRPAGRWLAAALVLAAVVVSLMAHPHYLAYFNRLAGGPDNGWRLVVDSNIDWGQDLQSLADYMAANDVASVNANWLGTAPLAAYGIEGRVVAGWPAAKEYPLYDWFYPPRPAPGFYAISATQLQGLYLRGDRSRFWWFRDRPPQAKAGYSLFLYDVPADGPPRGLALSGIPLEEIPVADFNRTLDSNDVRPRWYDARTSFVWAGGGIERAGGEVWAAVADGYLPQVPALRALYPEGGPRLTGWNREGEFRYHLFQWPAAPLPAGPALATFGDTFRLLEVRALPAETTAQPGASLDYLTTWEVAQQPAEAPFKIFLHLSDESGQLVAQHDGLDVLSRGLRQGDRLAQLHTIALPPSLPPGRYQLHVGVYREDTMERLLLADGRDRLPLPQATLAVTAP